MSAPGDHRDDLLRRLAHPSDNDLHDDGFGLCDVRGATTCPWCWKVGVRDVKTWADHEDDCPWMELHRLVREADDAR